MPDQIFNSPFVSIPCTGCFPCCRPGCSFLPAGGSVIAAVAAAFSWLVCTGDEVRRWKNALVFAQSALSINAVLPDALDWDSALREDAGRVNPLGLFDLNRRIRPVGKAYQQLIHNWRGMPPTGSYSLSYDF